MPSQTDASIPSTITNLLNRIPSSSECLPDEAASTLGRLLSKQYMKQLREAKSTSQCSSVGNLILDKFLNNYSRGVLTTAITFFRCLCDECTISLSEVHAGALFVIDLWRTFLIQCLQSSDMSVKRKALIRPILQGVIQLTYQAYVEELGYDVHDMLVDIYRKDLLSEHTLCWREVLVVECE